MKLHRVLPPIETSARTAVITGDADRIPVFAEVLGGGARTWQQRELVVTEAVGFGEPILVACHGQGGFGTTILVEELIDGGVQALVRVGSCGSLQPGLEQGAVIVTTGCVRDDGASASYLPPDVPAVPDARLLNSLCRSLDANALDYTLGLTHCKDSYYSADPSRRVLGRAWEDRYQLLTELGVLATEAEAAALFAVSMLRGARAAGLFVVGAAKDPENELLRKCAASAAEAMQAALDSPRRAA